MPPVTPKERHPVSVGSKLLRRLASWWQPVALRLAEEPTQFLSTVQIGITAVGILNGIVGEAALAGPLSELFLKAGLAPGASAIAATAIVVITITYISI